MTGGLPNRRKRRTSITKLQRQSAIATDLIVLCQTVTQDGHLEDQEIEALSEWLRENRQCDLPAVAFLTDTVTRILDDSRITIEERHELYLAIEAVLPPDIRESVRGIRRAGEQANKEHYRELKRAARAAEHEARMRNAPTDTWDFMVAGVRYEGRPEVIREFAEPGDTVFLRRDRANHFSRNAVEVLLSNGLQVGFVPEEYAVAVAPLLDSGHRHSAHIKKILTGGRSPIPVVVAALFPLGADAPDAVSEQQIPVPTRARFASLTPTKPALKSGCAVLLTIGCGLMAATAWWMTRLM